MTNPTVVLNVVGLDRATLKHMPNLASVGAVTDLLPVLPAVTCSAQATMLTGKSPAEHGVVGNGWYGRSSRGAVLETIQPLGAGRKSLGNRAS